MIITSIIFISGCEESSEPSPDGNEPEEPSYMFEPDWWLEPQTYGMFNYWDDTDFDRLEATNCTVNGYRLVYDFDLTNPNFDFQSDIDEAHNRGIKYVIGICFNGTIAKWPDEVAELASSGACAVTYEGTEAVQHGGEDVYFFSTNHSLWQETLIEQAKRIVDLNADGIAVIAPWGSSFYPAYGGRPDFSNASQEGFRDYLSNRYTDQELLTKGISNLESFNYLEYLHNRGIEEGELESAPLYDDYCEFQRESALEFYRRLVSEVKEYARSKGIENFPFAPANHGEWLVPRMINLLAYSDFAFTHLDFEDFSRAYQYHDYEYKLHYSATEAPLVAAPVDVSFGWLVQNSPKPEDLIQLKLAEAYANKGAFHDQYRGGLTEEGFLEYSVDAQAVSEINSFFLSHEDLFSIDSQSLAKVAVLFSAKSVTGVESEHWFMFTNISRILTEAHFQYDVIFSEDSSSSPNTLTLEKLQRYEVIILPRNDKLDNNATSLIPEYLVGGGKLVIINQADPGLSLPDGTSYIVLNWWPDPFQDDWGGNEEFLDALNSMLDKRVFEDTLPRDIGVQIWQDGNKMVVHLVNYGFDLDQGVIEKEDVPVSINLSLPQEPSSVKIISPDSEGEQILDYFFSGSTLQFVVPELKVWDILVIE